MQTDKLKQDRKSNSTKSGEGFMINNKHLLLEYQCGCFYCSFDKLGSVHHSKNKSLAVVLPVELSSTHHTHDGRAATCAGENTDGGNGLDEFTASGHGIAADFPEDNVTKSHILTKCQSSTLILTLGERFF